MENIKKETINFPFLEKPISIYTCKNGHKIVIAQKTGSGLANISSWVKTGSINEDDKNNGVSHFLEHLMFKGTSKHKAGFFDRILEAKGSIVNAATWKDYTFYYVTLPQGENGENFNLAIELHADMMTDPIIPEEEIGEAFNFNSQMPKNKRERFVVIEEISMRDDDPWSKTYNCLNYNMYTNHPYKRDVIGEKSTIASISKEEIMDYYKKHYVPNQITTIAVGDFDEEKILAKIVKEFNFKNRENTQPKEFPEDKAKNYQYIEKKGNVNTGFLMFGFLGPKAIEIKENIALEMLSMILGSGLSSRLYQNLIEKSDKNIFNLVNCVYYSFKDSGNFFIQANFKLDKKDEAIESIKNEIKNLKVTVSNEELQKVKKKLKMNFAKECETVSSISDLIGDYMTVIGTIIPLENYISIIEDINLNYLKEIAAKYLDLEKVTICALIKED